MLARTTSKLAFNSCSRTTLSLAQLSALNVELLVSHSFVILIFREHLASPYSIIVCYIVPCKMVKIELEVPEFIPEANACRWFCDVIQLGAWHIVSRVPENVVNIAVYLVTWAYFIWIDQ